MQMRQIAEPNVGGKPSHGPTHLVRADSTSGPRKMVMNPQLATDTAGASPPGVQVPTSKDLRPYGYTPLSGSMASLARAVSGAPESEKPGLNRESVGRR